MCFEAIYFCISNESKENYLQWLETLTEAYFLNRTISKLTGKAVSQSNDDSEYAARLLQKLQSLIAKQGRDLSALCELDGQIDQLRETCEITKARLQNENADALTVRETIVLWTH